MVDYQEIIRLHSLKFSNVGIANSIRCPRNTISDVLKLAETHDLDWPIPEALSNRDIEILFILNALPEKEENFRILSTFIRNLQNLE